MMLRVTTKRACSIRFRALRSTFAQHPRVWLVQPLLWRLKSRRGHPFVEMRGYIALPNLPYGGVSLWPRFECVGQSLQPWANNGSTNVR